MTLAQRTPAGTATTRGGFGRRGWRVASTGVILTAVAAGTVAGCSGSPSVDPTPLVAVTPASAVPTDPDPSAVVSSLGAVPIPPSTAPQPTPGASAGHPALSAAGGPIAVSLGDEGRAVVTVLGPEQAHTGAAESAAPASPQKRTRAYLTLQVRQTSGSATLGADELSSRDQTGRPVALAPKGSRVITTHAGSTSTLTVAGTFDSGAAQVTWRHQGKVLAIWTFTVELD